MTDKWKFMLKQGLFWGMFMTFGMSLIELQEKTAVEIFLSWNFLLKMAVYNIAGIVVVGYFNWRHMRKTRQ